MEKISLLQSEPTPEPIIEIEKPTVHPLLQAMQELKEEGVIDEYINKDTVTPDFTVEKEIQNGYILKAQGLENGEGIEINTLGPNWFIPLVEACPGTTLSTSGCIVGFSISIIGSGVGSDCNRLIFSINFAKSEVILYYLLSPFIIADSFGTQLGTCLPPLFFIPTCL